jgi:lipoate-protein ligase A
MRHLDLTLPTPEENLALAEAADDGRETLRLWEFPRPVVVVGRSSRVAAEVRVEACRQLGVPILRRTSGGAAIVAGPGCLMYSLVLGYRFRPALRAVGAAHQSVLGTLAAALAPLTPGIRCRGISDLAIGETKVSGNSVRARRGHLLYHGTLLYDFQLELIERLLAMPPRQPGYRQGRPHEGFVGNLPASGPAIRRALVAAWQATELCTAWPREETTQLAAEKYGRRAWNES